MQFKVYFVPTNRSFPEECGFMIYEGLNKKSAESTYRAAHAWIKEQQLALIVVIEKQ